MKSNSKAGLGGAAFTVIALLVVLTLRLDLMPSAFGQSATESQTHAPVQVGQTYKVLVGMGAMRFMILEVGKAGLVKVQAVEDGSFVGIRKGTAWWLNLNQTLLVEAIE